jgi:hypothetical protein
MRALLLDHRPELAQAPLCQGCEIRGVVTIQADGSVTLRTSSVEARSPNGSNTRGGVIAVRSFNGHVSGSNGVGLKAEGDETDMRGGTVEKNVGDGVQLIGNSNTLQGATVQSNGGVGINVSGTDN